MATHTDENESDGHCLICYDVLTYRSLLPCDHNEVCPVCMLRIRQLHKDKKCPICKQEHEQVIVEETSSQQHQRFNEYPVWGEELGSDFLHKDGIFYRVEYFERVIVPLLGYQCTNCSEHDGATVGGKSPLRGLQDHLRTKHRLQLCNLCTDNNRDFVSNLPRLSPTQMQLHLKQGDPGTAFKGHPMCEFCRPKRFYDLTQLHVHLNREHYKCDLCEKMGIPNQFFKHYNSLQRHFDNQHFLCRDAACLQARFVVFESELDLRHHEKQVHGAVSAGSKISLEFRYNNDRRVHVGDQELPTERDFDFTLDGVAFVPSDLPQSQDASDNAASGTPLHPLHLQRTAQLRQRAAQVAEEQGLAPTQPEAFPTLAAADSESTSAQLRAGWTSGSTINRVGVRPARTVGQVTESAFPSLGPSAAGPRPAKLAAKPRIPSAGGTFAAIQQAANQSTPSYSSGPSASWGQSSSSSTTTATVTAPSVKRAPNLTSSEQFPSLGGGGGSGGSRNQPYASAMALARQQRQQQPPSAEQFPSLGRVQPSSQPKPQQIQQQQQRAPDWNNTSHFPAPPKANDTAAASVRDRLLGERAPSLTASANVLQAPTTSSVSAKAAVDNLKTALGKQKYKELKRLTAEFAEGQLNGQGYIDMVAALFGRGYGDADFWNNVPALVESCPAQEYEKASAMRYMENLKRMKNGATNAEAVASSNSVARSNLSSTNVASSSGSWPNMSASTQPVARPSVSAAPRTVAGKTKAAWGGSGGASTTVVAKSRPGSVAVHAAQAQQVPQSATKFMAQEQKKAAANKNNNNNGKGKKKSNKQKNELRQLAFGL